MTMFIRCEAGGAATRGAVGAMEVDIRERHSSVFVVRRWSDAGAVTYARPGAQLPREPRRRGDAAGSGLRGGRVLRRLAQDGE
jgi:hypothetical protein